MKACRMGYALSVKISIFLKEGNKMKISKKKLKVVIEVMGGVATVAECPKEVEVKIIDYDLKRGE